MPVGTATHCTHLQRHVETSAGTKTEVHYISTGTATTQSNGDHRETKMNQKQRSSGVIPEEKSMSSSGAGFQSKTTSSTAAVPPLPAAAPSSPTSNAVAHGKDATDTTATANASAVGRITSTKHSGGGASDGRSQGKAREEHHEEEEIVIEQPLLTIKEVFVYKVPTLRASSGHRAEEWGLAKPVFSGESGR